MTKIASSGRQHAAFIDADGLSEALGTLHEYGQEVTVLAGGTDVMVQYLRGDIQPKVLLHIRRISELKGIARESATVIGAVTTHWEMMSDTGLKGFHPALIDAAATVGGRQTQNAGTVAGNLVNASPAADLLPVLLISDATVTLASASKNRTVAVSDFVVGRRATVRNPDELVTAVSLEPIGARTGEVYLKVGRRGAMEVAIVGLAARITFGEDGTVAQARIAVCSVASKAFRALDAERRLVGSRLDGESIREAGDLLRQQARPINDGRATAPYRLRLLDPLLRQAVEICRRRTMGAGL